MEMKKLRTKLTELAKYLFFPSADGIYTAPDAVEQLYKIQGDAPAEKIRRVEESVNWLISDEFNGKGKELLKRAFERQGKPTIINVSLSGLTERVNGNTIHLNVHQIENSHVLDSHGKAHKVCYEQVVGHELVHVAQPAHWHQSPKSMVQELTKPYLKKWKESGVALKSRIVGLSEDEKCTHVRKYVDDLLSDQAAIHERLHKNKKFQNYVKEIELPAVALENEVAAIKGLPARNGYSNYESKAWQAEELFDKIMLKLKDTEKAVSESSVHSITPKSTSEKTIAGLSKINISLIAGIALLGGGVMAYRAFSQKHAKERLWSERMDGQSIPTSQTSVTR